VKPLIVGESNPFGRDEYYALYPEPEGCSGDRLCRVVMGLRRRTYMAEFERANLVRGKWSMPVARERARGLTELSDEDRARLERFEIGQTSALGDLVELRTFILLGRKVAEAFGWKGAPQIGLAQRYHFFIFLPHPSGRNRVWNDPDSIRGCRAALRGSLPRIPFGEIGLHEELRKSLGPDWNDHTPDRGPQ
jgi:hypothetical protein